MTIRQKTLLTPRFLLMFLAAYTLAQLLVYSSQTKNTRASDLAVTSILQAVNKERAVRNLVTLQTDQRLQSAAQYKSDDMSARHYFSHTDPEGKYIWDKIVALGYTPYLQLGENLAIDFYDTESLVRAWMNSPTHRANLLSEGFRDQGVGLSLGNVQQGQYYSAIANTFGTLLTSKQTAAAPVPAPALSPAPKPVTKKQPAKSVPKTVSPAPAPVATRTPIAIRGAEDFALPQSFKSATASPEAKVQTQGPGAGSTAARFPLQASRRLGLVFGSLLLVLLISDIRTLLHQKQEHLDKKINNFVVLFLALLVVALLYWL